MKTAAWNVCSLYRAGAVDELVEEMDKHKADAWSPQEIRWPQGKKRIMILYSEKCTNKNWEER